MSRRNRFGPAAAGALMWMAVGCVGPQEPNKTTSGSTPALDSGHVRIQNDPVYLESRVMRSARSLAVRRAAAAGRGGGAQIETATPVSLTLVAEVLPPTVGGHVVQADDIDVDPLTRLVVVGYNDAGDEFAGALQVIDYHVPDHPVLVSEVQYDQADVNAVCKRGVLICAGLASADPTLATPAFLEQFKLMPYGLVRTGQHLDLPSWAVTDLVGTSAYVVATVGANQGGVVVLDGTTLHQVAFAPDADARACSFDGTAAVMSVSGGGSPHLVRRALPSLDVLSDVAVDGYSFDGAKGTIEVASPFSYLGAGDGGFQVRGSDGALLDRLDNRALAGLTSDLMVTNAVSVSGNLAFVAAGALGVQVVDLGRWFPGAPPSNQQGLSVLGAIDFGDGDSSNMVKVRTNMLVVAAGMGGIKLVRMDPLP
jgi:hypothetical protein